MALVIQLTKHSLPVVWVAIVSNHKIQLKEEGIKILMVEKGVCFPSCYQEVVQVSIQHLKENLNLKAHLSEFGKPITYLLKGKCLCVWTISPHRGGRLPKGTHNCLD